MKLPVTIADTWGDETTVAVHAGDDVEMVTSGHGDSITMFYTSAQALRLAKALKKAAKRAEASQ